MAQGLTGQVLKVVVWVFGSPWVQKQNSHGIFSTGVIQDFWQRGTTVLSAGGGSLAPAATLHLEFPLLQ